MATYLLTWNSNIDNWSGYFQDMELARQSLPIEHKWRAANSNIVQGDRLFMLKQKSKPTGIVAAGHAASNHYLQYDDTRGKDVGWVDCVFERVVVECPLQREKRPKWWAQGATRESWHSQNSGIMIPSEVAERLERAWTAHLAQVDRTLAQSKHAKPTAKAASSPESLGDDDDLPTEGKELVRQHKLHERDPRLRVRKIAEALKTNPKLKCEVCSFSFIKHYGDLGVGFIECHHTRPIREGLRETSLDELALVCSNCHRMLHRSGLIGIRELRSMVDRNRVAR